MKTTWRWIIGILAAFGAAAYAQRPGEAELGACLAHVLGAGTSFVHTHQARLVLGNGEGNVTLEVQGAEVVDFDGPEFRVTRGVNGEGPDITHKEDGQLYKRKMKRTELNSLRGYLALDPAWVLCHVREELEKFTVRLESNGEMSFTYTERFLLSDPESKRYGLYGERLVIDPVSGEIREYGVLMKHPRGGAVADRVYTYVRRGNGNGKTWDVDVNGYQSGAPPKHHTVQY